MSSWLQDFSNCLAQQQASWMDLANVICTSFQHFNIPMQLERSISLRRQPHNMIEFERDLGVEGVTSPHEPLSQPRQASSYIEGSISQLGVPISRERDNTTQYAYSPTALEISERRASWLKACHSGPGCREERTKAEKLILNVPCKLSRTIRGSVAATRYHFHPYNICSPSSQAWTIVLCQSTVRNLDITGPHPRVDLSIRQLKAPAATRPDPIRQYARSVDWLTRLLRFSLTGDRTVPTRGESHQRRL